MTTEAKKVISAKAAPAKKSRLSFFAEVVAELRKAHWPTKEEALRLSLLVLMVCVVVGAILWLLDLGFLQLVRHFLLGG